MNTQPTVCCVMLANGREAMVRRAVRSFKAQTYSAKRLLIWDTGELNQDFDIDGHARGEIAHVPAEAYREPKPTIGALRNEANAFWTEYPIIAHWDSDDWSHPNRIAEQVALLQHEQKNGVQVVGYRDMLFWREPQLNMVTMPEGYAKPLTQTPGEAWLYQNVLRSYCIGSSLCYWRSAWEARPFADLPKPGIDARGEDDEWHKAQNSRGETSVPLLEPQTPAGTGLCDPRMIASIHGANSSYYGRDLLANSPNWKRVPEWDEHCRKVMAL